MMRPYRHKPLSFILKFDRVCWVCFQSNKRPAHLAVVTTHVLVRECQQSNEIEPRTPTNVEKDQVNNDMIGLNVAVLAHHNFRVERDVEECGDEDVANMIVH